MKLKLKYLAIALGLVSGSALATTHAPATHATNVFGEGWYVGTDAGYSHQWVKSHSFTVKSDDPANPSVNNNRGLGDVKLGYQWGYGLRTELAYTMYADVDGGNPIKGSTLGYKLKHGYTVMTNIYYDIANPTKFTPYVMAGIGMSNTQIKANFKDGDSFKDNRANITWQAGVGTSYAFTDHFFGDLGVKYVDRGTASYDKDMGKAGKVNFKSDMTSLDTTVGIRYLF